MKSGADLHLRSFATKPFPSTEGSVFESSTATMVVTEEVDFEHEYQKLKEKVVQVESILQNKATLQKLKGVFAQKNAEAAALKQQWQEERDQLRRMFSKHDEHLKGQNGRMSKLDAREDNFKAIQSMAGDSISTADKIEALKVKLELTRERTALLEQELQMEEEGKIIEDKILVIEHLINEPSEKERSLRTMAAEITDLEMRIEKLEQLWHQEFSLQTAFGDEEVKVRDQRILELENIINERDVTINLVREEAEKNTIKLENNSSMYAPLATVGAQVRHRKFELEKADKSKRNDSLVGIGNQAAHEGRALADASLFHPSYSHKRADLSEYLVLYGVQPSFVWNHQSSPKLLEILDWICLTRRRNFNSGRYDLSRFNTLKFRQLSNAFLLKIKDRKSTEIKDFLNDSEELKASYAEMKMLFENFYKLNPRH